MNDTSGNSVGKCPFSDGASAAGSAQTNRDWWPNQLKLKFFVPTFGLIRSDGRVLRL